MKSRHNSRRMLRWSDLSSTQRTRLVVLGVVEILLTTIAARDLARRDPSQVRGPKILWVPALLVQPVGPPAYLLWGRR